MTGKAVLLLSGGLDSATCLAIADRQGFDVYALSFAYGQRHEIELKQAADLAERYKAREHKVINIDLRAFGGSALTDDIPVPKGKRLDEIGEDIPVTYVPARNTIFLALALGYAESVGAFDIFIGVNAMDYSGYPDCRPEYIEAFEKLANLATAAGVKDKGCFSVHTPLIDMTKSDIIRTGLGLGVDYSHTSSCYDPDEEGRACGRCEACTLRLKGFAENNMQDPAIYL